MNFDAVTTSDAAPAEESTAVTLQINVTPTDLPHLREILPHELRQFGDQVAEILLVLDRNRQSMTSATAWAENEAGLRNLVASLTERYPHIRLIDVDVSASAAARVASEFFGGRPIPSNDWRGAPIYPYFFGLWAARHNYVLHLDSDMMCGGGSQTWVAEAVALLRSKSDVLVCCPLPGPPTRDGTLTAQSLPREPHESLAFRAQAVTTRIFMIDRARLRDRVGALTPLRPGRKGLLLAYIDGYPPYETAEMILTAGLASSGLSRVDFLGSGDGMWSLHPPFRSGLFYQRLPWLISAIESGDVTDSQRGDYEVADSMIDWSDVRYTRKRRLVWHANRIRHRVVKPLIGAYRSGGRFRSRLM